MLRVRQALLALLLFPLLPASSQPLTDARAARVRQWLADSLAAGTVPGVSVTVMRNGRILWSEGLGFADLEQRVPVTTRTKFRVGSISKALTSVALALLWEEGRICLDSTVQAYVPSFPLKRWPVTVRQVAGHLAGIRHYRGQEVYLSAHYHSVNDGLAIFRDDTLLSPPGSRFFYSSYGWNLLSAVIEAAGREDFLHLMQRRVFAPLGMTQTVADQVDTVIPNRARWYTADQRGVIVNAPYVDNSYKWAGGGFLSTTEDLARFATALLERRLVKPATVDTLWTPQHTNDGTPTSYGIGWFIRPDKAGRPTVGHSGGSVGGTAQMLIWPKEGLVVTMLVNSDRPFIHHAQRIADEFLKE